MYSVEYGTQTQRAHFHALIFGHDFGNQKLLKKTKKGFPIFTSKELEDLWTYGHSSIGSATPESAYYIASYALKQHNQVDESTGEIVSDYMRCSNRPAIGLEYLRKHAEQLIDSGEKLPRYYRKKLAEENPDLLEQYEENILSKIKLDKSDESRERLAKWEIAKSKNKQQTSYYREDKPDIYAEKFNQYLENQLKDNYRRTYEI